MADESQVYAVLRADSALTALISTRFYDQMVPTNVATPPPNPFVVATVVDEVPENYLAQAPDISAFRLQFDIYGVSKTACKAILAAIRAALYTAGHYGCEVSAGDLPADSPLLRRISTDWLIYITRTNVPSDAVTADGEAVTADGAYVTAS